MIPRTIKHPWFCLFLMLAVLDRFSDSMNLMPGIGSATEADLKTLEIELLKVGRTVFDHQRLDHLAAQDLFNATDLNVSETCLSHSLQYAINIRILMSADDESTNVSSLPWSIQMFDAMGKIPTGILEMNDKWIGSFSECLNIRTKHQKVNFRGQYCTISFENVTETKESMLANLLVQTETTAGICWPSSCSEAEVESMINFLEIIPIPIHRVVKPGYCQTDAPATFDAATISVIALYVAFIVLVLIATIYDIIMCRRTKYQQVQEADGDLDQLLQDAKQGICHRALVCFSLYNNGKNISIAEDPGEKVLGCIHGIRVFSLLWVILMRTCDYATIMPIKDYKDVIASIEEWSFDIILNSTFSMDSMLFISGFCVAYSLLYKLKKSGGRVKDFVHYYIHGFLRVTPLLAMSVAFLAGPFYLLASGPQWPDMKIGQTACRTDWWKTLLYINNLFDTQNFCVEVSWYTSLEMQFYVVAPLILYPLYRWPIVGYVIGGLFCLITTLTPALLIHYKDLPGFPDTIVQFYPTEESSEAYNIDIYVKPWCRMGPYLIGIGLAYFLYRKDMKVKMNKLILWIGWMMAIALALALVFGNVSYFALKLTMSNALRSAYGALSRPAWALCIAWIVLVCTTGNGGYSNHFLSWRMFVSLSHFSYSLYLVHLYVMLPLLESYEGTMYFETYMLGLLYVGITFTSVGISSIFYFLFEAPVVQLEKKFAPDNDPTHSRRSSTLRPKLDILN